MVKTRRVCRAEKICDVVSGVVRWIDPKSIGSKNPRGTFKVTHCNIAEHIGKQAHISLKNIKHVKKKKTIVTGELWYTGKMRGKHKKIYRIKKATIAA